MSDLLIYPAGTTPACSYAAAHLKQLGIPLTDHPTPEITHLLLDVPSFTPEGTLRGGGNPIELLQMLPDTLTIIGGNLNLPCVEPYKRLDLLHKPSYLAQNAAITAYCTLSLAASHLSTTYADTPTLIIGWGRIGKALTRMLRSLDAPVTVAVRREENRAMLQALGYSAVPMEQIPDLLPGQKLLINTVPELVLDAQALSACPDCLKIDLASRRGLSGENVLWARGLPGIHAPASSGKLIAETVYKEVRS